MLKLQCTDIAQKPVFYSNNIIFPPSALKWKSVHATAQFPCLLWLPVIQVWMLMFNTVSYCFCAVVKLRGWECFCLSKNNASLLTYIKKAAITLCACLYFLLIRVFASQQSACGKTFWLPKLKLNCWISDLHLCILKQGQWNKPNTHRTTTFGDHKLHSMLFLQLQQRINDGSFLICNAVGCNDSEAPSDSSLPALGKQLGQLAGVSTFLYLYFYPTFSSSASADAVISLAHCLPFLPSYFRRLQKKMLQISLCLPTHIVHLMHIKHTKIIIIIIMQWVLYYLPSTEGQ